ncbi:MAG: alpha/beta hydrolase family protein [Gemmatimonadaceae bacterium]
MRTTLIAALLLTTVNAPRADAQWLVRLPQPTGAAAVGTTRFSLVDSTRREPFTADSSDHRELLIRVWYPAKPAPGAQPEPFWGSETQEIATRMAQFMRLPNGSFDDLARAPSHAYTDAPLANAPAPYPVLIFSHGYIPGLIAQNTAQMEELASHGYVVFSIGHAYETLVNVFPDGRVVPFSQLRLGTFAQGAGKTQELTAKYGAASDTAEKQATLRRIVAEWTVLDESLRIWTADTRFVLDELERLNAGTRSSIFAAMLDLKRVGVFGMSFGGATAGQVCAVDERCRAGVNLDGMQFGDLIERPMERPFMFMNSQDAGDLNRLFFERATDAAYYVTVKGSKHFNYSDFSLFSPDFQKAGILGPIDGERMERILSDYVLAFFDAYLKGRSQRCSKDLRRIIRRSNSSRTTVATETKGVWNRSNSQCAGRGSRRPHRLTTALWRRHVGPAQDGHAPRMLDPDL